jgi:hypothetical protein
MIDGMGVGWTFTLIGALCLVVLALFLVDYRCGTVWRQRGLARTNPPVEDTR